MKSLKVAVLLLFLLPILCVAQKKDKKASVPAVFDHARYVYVEAMDGGEFDRRLSPEDRVAIADVRDALKAWGRYVITLQRDKAELIFVVRKGRLEEGRIGIGVGGGQDPQDPTMGPQGAGNPGRQRSRAPSVDVGGEAGPKDDLLQVCQVNVDGKLSGPLWIQSEESGLDGPRVRLIAQFKYAVDNAYPIASAKP